MKFQLVSDLHLEAYPLDKAIDFIRNLPVEAETIVLAGDIVSHPSGKFNYFSDVVWPIFEEFAKKWKNLVYVLGNHECYGYEISSVYEGFASVFPWLGRFLNNTYLEIEGFKFYGGTMWYPDLPGNAKYKYYMNDPVFIKRLEPFIYESNKTFYDNYELADVVITHHLPSYKCVAPQYRGSPLNPFFVDSNAETLLTSNGPKVWCFGHTHTACDITINQTRVVCNPFGYPRERYRKLEDYKPKLIEVNK